MSKKRRNFWDVRSPVLRPLWLRVVIVTASAGWALLEFLSGNMFWAIIFGTAAAYLYVQLLLKFDLPDED